MKTQLSRILPLLVCGLLAACSRHQINADPDPSITLAGPFASAQDSLPGGLSAQNWWTTFDRPVLNDLIMTARENNQDIAAAVARIRQARAVSEQTGAARLPQIDTEGAYNKSWQGSDAQRATGNIGAALDWEVDIWGRISSAAQADTLEAIARSEDLEALKLSLSAEIANAYFGAVAAHRRIALLKEQLKLDRDLKNLLELRLENGVGTNVDVLRQEARVADAETLIPLAEADLAVFENRLDVLLGTAPDGESRVDSEETLDFIADMPQLGVPADLLLNRPDLRAARAELVAADADINAAIADRLPRITLDASYVFSDTALYSGPVSALMGMFVQPLLDWGQRRAAIEENKALYEERLAQYTQLFLEAVEDVENALVQEKKQREFLKRLDEQRRILQQTVDASEDRYTQGIDDYLPVIDALQELRQVERDLVDEHLDLVLVRIELFRATGGLLEAETD